MKPMGQIDGTDFATDAELDASLARGVGPRTEAGKALIEWAENAYPGQDQVRIWREHAVAIEAEASGEARPTPVEPEAPPSQWMMPDWRHAKWCEWERGSETNCNCGLDAFRRNVNWRRLAVEPDGLPLDVLAGLDLHCENYAGRDHRPRYDGCRANGRPRGGAFAAAQWCLPCEIRARLASTPSEAKP